LGGVRNLNLGYIGRRKYISWRRFKLACMECFEGLHEGYGHGEINVKGKFILDFSLTFDLTITNTSFRTREEHISLLRVG